MSSKQSLQRLCPSLSNLLLEHEQNKTQLHLVLIIDALGSMIPFQMVVDQLVDAIQSTYYQFDFNTFYFHNVPRNNLLYSDSQLTQLTDVRAIWETSSNKTMVIVISDAGAARGSFNQARIDETYQFIEQLRPHAIDCIWLNPVPKTNWKRTTAEFVVELLPMWEVNHIGLEINTDVLPAHDKKLIQHIDFITYIKNQTSTLTLEKEERGRSDIADFDRRFNSEYHTKLAQLAAVPSLLTPKLLHQIRSVFVPKATWISVADLLLSNLCTQVEYNVFEMDPTVRACYLGQLRSEPYLHLNELNQHIVFHYLQSIEEDTTVCERPSREATSPWYWPWTFAEPSRGLLEHTAIFAPDILAEESLHIEVGILKKSGIETISLVNELAPTISSKQLVPFSIGPQFQEAMTNLKTPMDKLTPEAEPFIWVSPAPAVTILCDLYWPWLDLAHALLLMRYYYLIKDQRLAKANALSEAKRWLHQLEAKEVAAQLAEKRRTYRREKELYAWISNYWRDMIAMNPDTNPFVSPAYGLTRLIDKPNKELMR